jgi:hypothetical protein
LGQSGVDRGMPSAGAKGILFTSTQLAGGRNLVVYNDTLQPGDMVQPYDPAAALPKSQNSWR